MSPAAPEKMKTVTSRNGMDAGSYGLDARSAWARSRLSSGDDHLHAVAGPQRHARLHGDPLLRRKPEAPALRERREHEHSLGPRELLTDADARARAEGEVRELRALGRRLGAPAVRVEAVRYREPARIAVLHELAHDDDAACRNHVVTH